VREAGGHGGVAERRDVLRRVGVGWREPVGDDGKAEPRDTIQRGGALGLDHAPVVVLGVDEGDVEAACVEELGQLEHGRDVALSRVRHAHRMRPRHLLSEWSLKAEEKIL
jgi:hypothetical protein